MLFDALRQRHGSAALGAIDRLALGCVTQVGPLGRHVALMVRSRAGLPDTAVATTLNNYCV